MEKRIVAFVLTLMILGLASWARAQDSLPPKVFSGTITNIDWQKQELGVQNKYGTVFLKWDQKTQFHPADFRQRLKEGTQIFVYFSEGPGQNLIASRIELNWAGFGLKGLQYPFDCGLTVC